MRLDCFSCETYGFLWFWPTSEEIADFYEGWTMFHFQHRLVSFKEEGWGLSVVFSWVKQVWSVSLHLLLSVEYLTHAQVEHIPHEIWILLFKTKINEKLDFLRVIGLQICLDRGDQVIVSYWRLSTNGERVVELFPLFQDFGPLISMELLDVCLTIYQVMIIKVVLNFLYFKPFSDHMLSSSELSVRHDWVKLIRCGNCVFIWNRYLYKVLNICWVRHGDLFKVFSSKSDIENQVVGSSRVSIPLFFFTQLGDEALTSSHKRQ